MKTYAAIWTTFSLLLTAPATFASECRDVAFEDTSFTICEADPAAAEIALYLSDSDGHVLGTFDNLVSAVETGRIAWAMNGGMYHSDRRPVGLYIEDGREVAPLVTREGPGNFGLLPNGVLCLSDTGASVTESRVFATQDKACTFATQSGPMLVIDGALHPRFLPNSDSLNIRNGVGVTPEGMLVAAISNEPVNFHRFARLFRDVLGTPNALFLDGTISRLYAPGLDRHDLGFPMGPILGVVATGN
ncbi:MAG: phosphodiester glycosidase family protein [Paracoccaceae bacterium]